MKHLVVFCMVLCIINQSFAQNAVCKVLSDSIAGTYIGDCKNGKADGIGKSTGLHEYDGDFKNGWPEGKGKYTWPNGDYYYGGWRKGMKEGKGELHLPVNDVDSVIYGYWKKGMYVGQFEAPFKIMNNTTDIGRVEINKIRGSGTNITVSVENLMGGGNFGGGILTKMTDHRVTRGSYQTKATNALTNKEVTTFKGVIFPFRVWMFFANSNVEIEFYETGEYDVRIPINK